MAPVNFSYLLTIVKMNVIICQSEMKNTIRQRRSISG